MARISCVNLKEEASPKEKSLLSIEPCLKVEELIKSYKLESLEKWECVFDAMKEQRCLISTKICFAVMDLELPPSTIEQMLHHIEFYKIADHTVTEAEFEVLFSNSPVAWYDKEALRDHNKRCTVFFIKGYSTLFKEALVIPDDESISDEIFAEVVQGLSDLIRRHQETRAYFRFCEGCEHHTPKQCRFWEEVARSLQHFHATVRDKNCINETRKYLSGLDLQCRIPKTLDELKQGVQG